MMQLETYSIRQTAAWLQGQQWNITMDPDIVWGVVSPQCRRTAEVVCSLSSVAASTCLTLQRKLSPVTTDMQPCAGFKPIT